MQEYHYNLVLFKEIKRFWNYRDQVGLFAMFTNLFGNVIIFMPFGFFMPMASRYRSFFSTLFWSFGLSLGVESFRLVSRYRSCFSAVFYSFGLSLCVETFQLLTKVGSFDVDDLLLNTIGGLAGYVIFAVCAVIRRRYADKEKTGHGRR